MLTRCCDDAESSLQRRFFQVDNHETDVVKSLVVISNRGHHFVRRDSETERHIYKLSDKIHDEKKKSRKKESEYFMNQKETETN